MTGFWERALRESNSPEFIMSERPSSPSHRFDIERRKLNSAWPTVATDLRYGPITQIAGTVRTASMVIRDFIIKVPSTYPYGAPHAFAVGWNPGPMHTYAGNELCLWRPEQWTQRYTLAYAVAKTFTWIHKHEVYLRTGQWPGKGQAH